MDNPMVKLGAESLTPAQVMEQEIEAAHITLDLNKYKPDLNNLVGDLLLFFTRKNLIR